MSSIITQTCNGFTVTLQIDILSVEKGGEKESEKKVTQRKEKEKDPERESVAGPLNRIAEAWNRLPLKKITRFTGRRKERTEMLLAQYPEEEILRAIYSIARSPFLLGGGASHWQIRFDWFIVPENFRKVREGNYLDDEAGVDDEPGIATDRSPGSPEPSLSLPGTASGRLRYSRQDLQDINRVWTDSSD